MFKKNKIVMIMGTIFLVIIILVAVVIFLLVKDDYRARPSKDFAYFQTEEISKNNRSYLLISGEYNGSSLKIRKVKDESKNGEIKVNVYTTLFSKNDASFLHAVELGNSINKVVFGADEKVIWERK